MIKAAINGYGNLGRGVERAVAQASDMECVAIFTRRAPEQVQSEGAPVLPLADLDSYAGKLDVVINCGGSATDLRQQTPAIAEKFNVVDSFDTHAKIPAHFAQVAAVAEKAGTTAVISAGWDPGLFSLLRALGDAVLPQGKTTTFWGPGVSQGHSDAIRRIPGVVDARQYTVPVEATVAAVKAGKEVELTPRTMHKRICYVVVEAGADKEKIAQQIATMPDYFADYDVTVNFLSAEELQAEHGGIPHGGIVIRRGTTSENVQHGITFQLELDSNPEFTGAAAVAVARAAVRKAARQEHGAFTIFDLTLQDLSPRTAEDLRAHWL